MQENIKFNLIITSWSVRKYLQASPQVRPTFKTIHKINNNFAFFYNDPVHI